MYPFRFFQLLCVFQLGGATLLAQEITLKSTTIKPYRYVINQILDRREHQYLGKIIDANGEMTTLKTAEPFATALKKSWYMRKSKNDEPYPVNVLVRILKISESFNKEKKTIGKINISIVFSWTRDSTEITLCNYNTELKYARSLTQLADYESIVNGLLDKSLQYLNDWMKQNWDKNSVLARCVRVLPQPAYTTNTPESDTVFHAERPLTWNDFPTRKSNDLPSKRSPNVVFGATIFSNFLYEAPAIMHDGCIEIKLQVKTYMQKSMSWALPETKNSYTLSHEQLHFDIARLIAERFKSHLAGQSLSVEDYDSQMQLAFLDFYRAMTDLQKQYDEETEHGINRSTQAQWQQRITQQLRIYVEK